MLSVNHILLYFFLYTYYMLSVKHICYYYLKIYCYTSFYTRTTCCQSNTFVIIL